MPTAIFIMYTTEGFALAADGRRCTEEGTIVDDEAQKLFPLCEPRRQLVYALAGTVCITDSEGSSVVFDFVSEVPKGIQFLSSRKPRRLDMYSRELAYWLNQRLRKSVSEAKSKGLVVNYPDDPMFTYHGETGSTVARLFLAGYYNSTPGLIQIRFSHSNQTLDSPMVTPRFIQPGELMWYGSPVVARSLENEEDSRFSAYRMPRPERTEQTTLSEALERARQAITAQSSPQAREVDPELCSLIGGKVQVAKVTRKDGFQWVDPPVRFSTSRIPSRTAQFAP